MGWTKTFKKNRDLDDSIKVAKIVSGVDKKNNKKTKHVLVPGAAAATDYPPGRWLLPSRTE